MTFYILFILILPIKCFTVSIIVMVEKIGQYSIPFHFLKEYQCFLRRRRRRNYLRRLVTRHYRCHIPSQISRCLSDRKNCRRLSLFNCCIIENATEGTFSALPSQILSKFPNQLCNYQAISTFIAIDSSGKHKLTAVGKILNSLFILYKITF